MQILHPFAGSVQQYAEQLADPDCYRPGHCPQCQAKHPLTAHGFYTRTLIDTAFDGVIRVRRYLCQACQRTVSLLPEFVLPYPAYLTGYWQKAVLHGITEFPHNSWSQREDGLRYDRVYPIQLRIQSLREA